jgi:transposase
MGKRKYRAIQVKQVDAVALSEELKEGRVVVSVDVAKEDFFAAIQDTEQRVHATVKWDHPGTSWAFIGLLEQLRDGGCEVEVVMEPSGTYGDALRVKLWERGFPVFRVSPKRSHDAAEVYDGVPSLHDAKSAAIVGKLHLDGASEPWPLGSDEERLLSAALRELGVHEKAFRRNRDRLEGLLARHWPELSKILKLGSATLLELLTTFGGPTAVAGKPKKARQLMRRVGGQFLDAAKVDQVVESACSSFGVPQIPQEQRTVKVIAGEARRSQKLAQKAQRRVERLTESLESTKAMAPVLGKTTAAVVVAAVGDPRDYDCPDAYRKSAGLNLKEKSSGKHQGGLHITKRGPGVARMYLYLAALRLIQKDVVIRAWYAKKVQRQGGQAKPKAVVAVMRKLIVALWHVARGSQFDSTKLFDVSRLDLPPAGVQSAALD